MYFNSKTATLDFFRIIFRMAKDCTDGPMEIHIKEITIKDKSLGLVYIEQQKVIAMRVNGPMEKGMVEVSRPFRPLKKSRYISRMVRELSLTL